MQGNRKTGTRPEVEIRRRLHRRGFRFRKNKRLEINGFAVTPDIVFPRQQLAVFVDGCFWHGCPDHFRLPRTNASYWDAKIKRNMARDRRVTEGLASGGWQVLRVWEHADPDDAAGRIGRHLVHYGSGSDSSALPTDGPN